MPTFNKTESELTTRFDKWCYFLKNLETFDHIPTILQEPIFEKAFHTSEIGAMSQKEYDIYKESLMSYWESKGMIETAKEEGRMEGRVEGEKIGIEKGRVEGEKIGEKKNTHKVIINAIKLDMSNEQISLLTGLSVEEIQEIRENIQ
jgi:predicted transposase/invertase (TIGR01784 family)